MASSSDLIHQLMMKKEVVIGKREELDRKLEDLDSELHLIEAALTSLAADREGNGDLTAALAATSSSSSNTPASDSSRCSSPDSSLKAVTEADRTTIVLVVRVHGEAHPVRNGPFSLTKLVCLTGEAGEDSAVELQTIVQGIRVGLERTKPLVASQGSCVYLLGGIDGLDESYSRTCSRSCTFSSVIAVHDLLKPGCISTKKLPHLPRPRHSGHSVILGENLYVMGGSFNGSEWGSIFYFKTRKWVPWKCPTEIDVRGDELHAWPVPSGNDCHQQQLLIYSLALRLLYLYDPAHDSWELIVEDFYPPVDDFGYVSAAFHDNIIYVCVACNVYAYDFPQRRWFKGPVRFSDASNLPDPEWEDYIQTHLLCMGPKTLCLIWSMGFPYAPKFFGLYYSIFIPIVVDDDSQCYVSAQVILNKKFKIEGYELLNCLAMGI